jgi:hypothetical protein
VWLFTLLAFSGLIVVGLLDWNSLDWPPDLRWFFGIVMILGGNILAWTGVWQLSMTTTSGSRGTLGDKRVVSLQQKSAVPG